MYVYMYVCMYIYIYIYIHYKVGRNNSAMYWQTQLSRPSDVSRDGASGILDGGDAMLYIVICYIEHVMLYCNL